VAIVSCFFTFEQAKRRLIDSPWLMRIPDLGTIVNAA
jgi:hypothetical protein